MDLYPTELIDGLLNFRPGMLENLHQMDKWEHIHCFRGNVGGRKSVHDIGSLGMDPHRIELYQRLYKKEKEKKKKRKKKTDIEKTTTWMKGKKNKKAVSKHTQ